MNLLVATLLSIITLNVFASPKLEDVYKKCLKKEESRFSKSFYDKERKILCLKGTIDDTTIYSFYDGFSQYEVERVILNSGGGLLRGGQEVAKYIRDNKIDTEVPNKSKCLSNCALVFAAGIRRYASSQSRIGVHYVYKITPELTKKKKIKVDLRLTDDYLFAIDNYSSSNISSLYYDWSRSQGFQDELIRENFIVDQDFKTRSFWTPSPQVFYDLGLITHLN